MLIIKVKRALRLKLIGVNLFTSFFLKRDLQSKPVNEYSESSLIKLFFKYYPKYKVLLDVGAHFGESFSSYEKIGWKVFAFEPDPNNRKHIKTKAPSTKVFDFAVSEQDDLNVTLYTSVESSGISSLTPFHSTHRASITVTTKTLATICRNERINHVDFLKIDTEGFDLFVLKGFPFESVKPRVILCEFEDKKTLQLGYSYSELGNFLTAQGYMVYLSEWKPIVKYGVKHEWRRIVNFPAKMEDSDGWGNFIAIRFEDHKRFELIKNAYLRSLNLS